jgi:hypothetical protein
MFDTLRIRQSDSRFDQCYALLLQTFSSDELVSYSEYAYLLSHPTSDHEFVMLARVEGDTLVGVVAGSYLALQPTLMLPCEAFAMIEYLAISQTGKGHGSALLKAFEETMLRLASERNQHLRAVVGEVEEDLLPFKFKTGYRLLEKVWYAQPPIMFNHQGQPLHPILPKLLMMKPLPDRDYVDVHLLRRIVATIYLKRYVPLTDPDMMAHIERYIFEHLFSEFERSLTERDTVRLFNQNTNKPKKT